MGKYTKEMLVFGLGVLVVSMWCMEGTEGDIVGETIHAVKRDDLAGNAAGAAGCVSSHVEGGVEECTDEDDSLGLYTDVDDTFRAAVKKVTSVFHHHDDDDSPDVSHNNVDFLGH
ncbi:hypothetical protein Fmac_030917 [Flemingia macrophylla]|uniref:Uncharacterized protein n=1 Tax=Flemingia macrophylla TaxID=520843 RepID=A0ABD1L0M0_9FABA